MVVKILKKGNSVVEIPLTPTVKKPLSPRDEKLVSLVANGSKKAPAMIKVGYSPKTARAPGKVFNKPEVKEAVLSVVERIQRNRDRIIAALEKKDFEKQSPFNLTAMMNMHTKDAELLSGRPTDRTAYELPEEEKTRLRKLFEKNKKK